MMVDGFNATDFRKIDKSCLDIATDSFIRIHVIPSLQGYVVREPAQSTHKAERMGIKLRSHQLPSNIALRLIRIGLHYLCTCSTALKLEVCRRRVRGLSGRSPAFQVTQLRPNKSLFMADIGHA